MTDLPVRITARRDEAIAVFALELAAVDGGELPSWSPGAHIDVAVGELGVRQYSLCGDPADRRRWRIAILREPDGRGGSDLLHHTANPDSELRVSLPRNNFELKTEDRYLFVAGGIGITPILPMVAAAARSGTPWELYYGARTRRHMAFADEIGKRYPNARLVAQDVDGLLPLTAILDERADATVYCCGPEPLLDAVETAGAQRGITVRTERFVPRAVDTTADRAFDIELARDGRTLRVGARQSIVDVLESAGVSVVTSCREGTCGSCETLVVAGEIEHRDSILTDEERARGKTIMLCVSRAGSDRLVLDL
ncbi:PDR/VanB family oxidoreductase [Nocardia noduli]|uniref:PDR/VanB family oxidoreductase n=1 Tax=Nocardia noduli TaxID=2815722 RepID=UPI001C23CF54|nr:PDR/VanB family oxidoreductase [Nocardia noduli]